jgi:transposase InsO family protein
MSADELAEVIILCIANKSPLTRQQPSRRLSPMGWATVFVIGFLLGSCHASLRHATFDVLAENALLRLQLATALQRAPKQPRISPWIRFVIGWLCRMQPRLLESIRIVRPETVLRWHREGFRVFWKWKSWPRGGRPKVARELRELIRRVSCENPLWGAPRIHGELLKLGFTVAESTVAKYMVRRHGGSSQGWKTFLRNHAGEIAAIDMLTVPTLCFEQLYAFVALGHRRRKLLHIEVTHHPSAQWLARQITEAFPWDTSPRFLVRDNDGAYGSAFRKRLYGMGICDCPTAPHSPWQNGYAERVIGSIRRECLDHVIILNAAHLRRVLRAYADYYNNDRTHLSLDKDSPNSRPVERDGAINSRPVLGGLHHRYGRIPSG